MGNPLSGLAIAAILTLAVTVSASAQNYQRSQGYGNSQGQYAGSNQGQYYNKPQGNYGGPNQGNYGGQHPGQNYGKGPGQFDGRGPGYMGRPGMKEVCEVVRTCKKTLFFKKCTERLVCTPLHRRWGH